MSHHIVYIIGAGLTKALELLPKPVPLMNDFVHRLAERSEEDDTIRVHLAHIEIADLFDHRSPEARAAVIEMLVKENDTPEVRQSFREALKVRAPENIESLIDRAMRSSRFRGQNPLTYMDQSDLRVPELGANIVRWFALGEAHLRFIWAINSYFRWIGWDLKLELLRRFVRRQLALPDTKHTFISFNYDLALDRCLQSDPTLSWNVGAGYGIPIHYRMLTDSNGQVAPVIESIDADECANPKVRLLKPHGSFNWLASFDEEHQFHGNNLVVVLGPNREIAYFNGYNVTKARLPDSGILNLAVFVYPPHGDKRTDFTFIEDTLAAETEAIEDADQIYIIGWSMPPTDYSQIDLIEGAVRRRSRSVGEVVAVNYGAAPEYFDKVATIFRVSDDRIRRFNDGFQQFVDSYA